MKSFIYTSSTEVIRRGRSRNKVVTVNVYRVVKNRPVCIGKLSDYYTSPFQLVMSLPALHKQLPARAFLRYPNGCTVYNNPAQLETDGIAYVAEV